MPKDTHIIEIKTKGAKKSQKDIKGVGGALGGMAKKAGIAAAAYFGTRMLLDGVKQSIDLFAKQELAEKKLRFAAGDSTQELIKQAKALQMNTKFGDEAIIAQQAYVASLGISTEQTKEIIEASVDLAAAMGISLESAVMNTTKTLSGMQGELGEKLPAAFKLLTAEQLKAGEGIAFIREQFKGTAEEETKTLSGALAQMSNAIGDAGEVIGEVLAPTVIAAANGIKFLAEGFQSLMNWQNKYKALSIETLGVISEQDANFLSMQRNIENQTKRTEVLSDIQETFNQINANSNMIYGENAELQDQFNVQQLATMISSGQLAETITLLRDNNVEYAEVLQQLLDRYNQLPETTNIVADSFEVYRLEQELAIKTEKDRIANQEKFIKLYPEQAKALGMVTKEEMKRGKLIKSLAGQYKEVQLSQIIGDTFSAARAQFKEFSKAYPAPIGQILGAAAYAATLKQGYSDVASVRAAQYGADFITSGPQMMMVGEGSGPERVQVTPLIDENIDGPQGGGITLNISGNVMSEEYTEDVIIPQIKEGLRLGGDIGVN